MSIQEQIEPVTGERYCHCPRWGWYRHVASEHAGLEGAQRARLAAGPAPRIAATRERLTELLRDAWRLGDADRGLILKLDRERWIAGRLDELEKEGA